jgi:uncharacterized delta-60 repeat protein
MRIVTTILSALFLALGATTSAQPGSLDNSFNVDGIVTTSIGTVAIGHSVAIQLDGKIVVAGSSYSGTTVDLTLIRYNTDGSLDNSFGIAGIVTTTMGTTAIGKSVAIQPDGKIVVAGWATDSLQHYAFGVARYNTDGSLDDSFSTDGKVTTDIGTSHDLAWSVAIQPDEKIVVTGSTSIGNDVDFALARYNTDGSLDNDFGIDGIVITGLGGLYDLPRSVAIQTDGKIVVAGSSGGFTDSSIALVRYNTDGSLDDSFGTNGKVTTAINTGSGGTSVAIQPDGRIVVAGSSNNGPDSDFALARYNTDGSLDNSFSVDGKVTTDFGTDDDYGYSVAIQPDGKIVVCGQTIPITDNDFAVARYNTDGSLDNSFGVAGKVTFDLGTDSDEGESVTIQPDGKIVTAGSTAYNSFDNYDIVVARLISGLDIGIIDLSLANSAPLIYPNPIDKRATLEYTLRNAETISIQLLDMQGKTVRSFIQGQHQAAGEHQLNIDLPAALPSGIYLIAISSPKGQLTVQVVK